MESDSVFPGPGKVKHVRSITKDSSPASATARGFDVPKAAARSLGQIGNTEAVAALTKIAVGGPTSARIVALEWLAKLRGKKAIPVLVNCLTDVSADVRRAARTRVAEVGSEAVGYIVPLMQHERWFVRASAAHLLGQLGGDKVVPLLVPALGDRYKTVRDSAEEALRSIGTASAKRVILQRTTPSPVGGVDNLAKRARRGSRRAIDELIAAAASPGHPEQDAAIESLGTLDDIRAIHTLVGLLPDQSWATRRAACEALARIGKPATAALLGALNDSNSYTRFGAARALGLGGCKSAERPLIELLRDPDEYVQGAAVMALGVLRSSRAVPHLLNVAKGD
ncbi:MAG TPA: HEAT repeat domain-containing protein [bacterium]|nr:HEAT repeat domain-containing protein [bacterium]